MSLSELVIPIGWKRDITSERKVRLAAFESRAALPISNGIDPYMANPQNF
jgi:hypothetical protein